MAEEDFEDRLTRLGADLGHLVDLLRNVGETRWADWLESDLDRIEAFDAYGLTHLLAAYGGMGSLTDLYLHPLNGHPIAHADVEEANSRLRHLRSSVHSMAEQLERELDTR